MWVTPSRCQFWDEANNQFLFGLTGGAEMALAYDAAPNQGAAVVPFMSMQAGSQTVANCHVAPASIDSTTLVGTVLTSPVR